jgi:CRP-like cAMP-binding protein
MNHLEILRNHPVLGELPGASIQRLVTCATRRRVRRGTTIFAKGDAGTQLVAVLSGRVKIAISSPEGREAVLNVVHEGEVFGEIALFDGRPRTAAAIAITDCELMSIDRCHFLPLVRQQPDIAIKLIEILCARLRRSSEQYEDIMFLNLRGAGSETVVTPGRGSRWPDTAQGAGDATGNEPTGGYVTREHQQAVARLGASQMGAIGTRRRGRAETRGPRNDRGTPR